MKKQDYDKIIRRKQYFVLRTNLEKAYKEDYPTWIKELHKSYYPDPGKFFDDLTNVILDDLEGIKEKEYKEMKFYKDDK